MVGLSKILLTHAACYENFHIGIALLGDKLLRLFADIDIISAGETLVAGHDKDSNIAVLAGFIGTLVEVVVLDFRTVGEDIHHDRLNIVEERSSLGLLLLGTLHLRGRDDTHGIGYLLSLLNTLDPLFDFSCAGHASSPGLKTPETLCKSQCLSLISPRSPG